MPKLNILLVVFGLIFLLENGAAQSPLQYEVTRASRPRNFQRSKSDNIHSFGEISPKYKLNDTYIPESYKLELTVYMEDDELIEGAIQYAVPGTVDINFKVGVDSTDEIILHVNPYFLTVDSSSIMVTNLSPNPLPIGVNDIILSGDDMHFFTVKLNESLNNVNSYQIHLGFTSRVNNETLDGLYLTNYTDADFVFRRAAVTQMQAYHARQLFPCFDESGLKATFDLSVIHKNSYTVLGNGQMISNEQLVESPWAGVYYKTTFATTVPMSTYLFAMVVSNFDYVQAPDGLFGKTVRTYAPTNVIAKGGGTYSAEIAAKLLAFFDSYFDTEYPLDKMDSVHAPHFSAGAMENWGLNLYRENYLIYYPGEHTEAYRNLLTSVVSHELAHQNFGNRVTCKFWDELWLNEGFATYVSYLGVDGILPEFRQREWILNDAIQYSMLVDVSSDSHPIINDAVTPKEVDSYFTGITYEKGGSINRMTEAFLNESTYQKGLRNYLRNKNYQGVVSKDLFDNLDAAAREDNRLPDGLTMNAILGSWTGQKSHPLVRVSVANQNSVYISQERYADPDSVSLWYVPVTIVTQDKPTLENHIPQLWLEENVPIKVHAHDTSKWIMINQDATGYYRTLYDTELTNLIIGQLNNDASVITPLSRSQLLDDYFNLAYLGHVDISTAMELTKYLDQEEHFTVWEVVSVQLRKTYVLLQNDDDFEKFKNYLLPKVMTALNKVGVEQTNAHQYAQGIYRAKLMDWACALGDMTNECVQYAHQLHSTWESNLAVNPVPADIQGTVFCAIVSTGGDSGFNFILNQFKAAEGSYTRTPLLNALACPRDAANLQKALDLTLMNQTQSGLTVAESIALVQRVTINVKGRGLVIDFLKTNLARIIEKFESEGLKSVMRTVGLYLSTQDQLDEVLKFVADHLRELDEIQTDVNTNLYQVRKNILWYDNFGGKVVDFMAQNSNGGGQGNGAEVLKISLGILALTFLMAVQSLF